MSGRSPSSGSPGARAHKPGRLFYSPGVKTTRLQVTLRDVEPAVIRVLDVPAANSLPELHDLLQVGVGWTDSHLHQFSTGEKTYGIPDVDAWEDQEDESSAYLKDLPARFVYLYDFGDGWEHDVEVLGTGADRPGCVFGEGMCPPEDCGGAPGYAQLLEALADPEHDEHEAMSMWAGELSDFDQASTDLLVRQTVGEVPASVRLILDLAQGGVKLTTAGRLPRAFARQVQQHRPRWAWSDEPVSSQDDLYVLAVMHHLLRKIGLLRLSRGKLTPTRAAADDLQIVRRLRSWFDADRFTDLLAGASAATLAAHGPMGVGELAAAVHPYLGHGWSVDGRPVTEEDVRRALWGASATLRALDLLEIEDQSWRAGASAITLLPRATALSFLWSRHLPAEAHG
jgi:hypothetical protein